MSNVSYRRTSFSWKPGNGISKRWWRSIDLDLGLTLKLRMRIGLLALCASSIMEVTMSVDRAEHLLSTSPEKAIEMLEMIGT